MKHGIYTILNTSTNSIYIGQSIDVSQRIRKHKEALRSNRHDSPSLQENWNAYGEESFAFNLIERIEDKGKLLEREEFWTKFYKEQTSFKVFNICIGKKLSDELKKHLSEMKIGKPGVWRGKRRSVETNKKISDTLRGRNVGKVNSEIDEPKPEKQFVRNVESRRKMSESKVGKDPHNKFPITEELLADIDKNISYKDFEEKYGKSKNTLKRIKRELIGEKRIRIRDPLLREEPS